MIAKKLGNLILNLFPALRSAGGLYRHLVACSMHYTGQIDVRLKEIGNGGGDAGWRIIRYPRIIDPEESIIPIHKTNYIRPKTFAAHMRYLKKHCSPLPLEELTGLLREEDRTKLPKKAVAVTLDGGWEDHYRIAAPTLIKYGIPATFSVPSAFIGTNNLFWRDKILLGLLILKENGKDLPHLSTFNHEILKTIEKLSTNASVVDGKLKSCEITPVLIEYILDILQLMPVRDRFGSFVELGSHISKCPDVQIERVFMTWQELSQIASQASFTIASMGHRKLTVTEVPPEELATDLRFAYMSLHEQEIPYTQVYCFPDGLFSVQAIELLQKLGIKDCLSMGKLPRSIVSQEQLRIFERKQLFQDTSRTKALFACNLWDIESLGIAF